MLNAGSMPSQELEAAFAEYAGLDENKFDCFIDTNSIMSMHNTSQYDMATSQKLMALTQTKDLDIAVFDSEVYNNYAYNEMFTDLRTIFTEQELAPYKDHLYYIDYAYIRDGEGNMDYENPALLYYDNFTTPSRKKLLRKQTGTVAPRRWWNLCLLVFLLKTRPLFYRVMPMAG